jgi:hypothetical protein
MIDEEFHFLSVNDVVLVIVCIVLASCHASSILFV